MARTLYVVATPIGNLEDVTFRALRILREVALIAAEDTRRTARLLAHYDIRTSVVSLREHNEARETPRLLARLDTGEDVALVSDAGTPVISDPGARLVRTARERGFRIVPIPGASAVVTALAASGFAADQFVFLGYPPASGQERERWMEAIREEPRVIVFFEAPHRITRTLNTLKTLLADRPMIVARELTKINEELVLWPIDTLVEKGEFTVVVAEQSQAHGSGEFDSAQIGSMVGCLTKTLGIDESRAHELAGRAIGVPAWQVRKAVKLDRYARKRRSSLDD